MQISRRHLFSLLAAAGLPAGAEVRKEGMIVRSVRPEDLEMPLSGFKDYLTPAKHFFVRSHHYVPKVEAASWRCKVDGLVERETTFTLDELKKLPRAELVGVLECAGNGRAFSEPPVPGLQWATGGVGNARWTGVRLADVLKKAGVKNGAQVVWFDGADVPIGTMPEFQRTITMKKAMDPNTLLAFDMNGEALPIQHGFPMRLIVPGWAGDSWVKWVTGIRPLEKDFDGFWMKTGYRHPQKPVAPGSVVDAAAMVPVTSLSVKSLIASPVNGAQVAPGVVKLTGVAWSGGPAVTGVDVSVNSGRTWKPARLGMDRSTFGWRQWEYEWTAQEGYYTVMARARDASGDTQPFAQEWNPSGYLHNVVPQVGIVVAAHPAMASQGSAAGPLEMSAKFRRSCIGCHEADVIEQQRLTRGQWDKEIDKMVRWGAKVDAGDREDLLQFLVNRFGPRARK
jgi:sulfite oxidase